jgi:hypothetical protein
MNNWLQIDIERRRSIIETLSNKTGLSLVSIEKDWWVSEVLRGLFLTSFASHLSFKGGTSLSKCWNLIERFSFGRICRTLFRDKGCFTQANFLGKGLPAS